MELHHLMLGPTAVLMGILLVDSLSLHCIYAYKMAHAFPVGTEATFEDISEKCGLNLIDTRRILRHAMTNNILQETRSGITTQALQKFGYAKEPNQSGFILGHQTTNGLYEEVRSHPSRGHRWANAMSAYASKITLAPLISTYDWASLGSATVVDVGGGYGPKGSVLVIVEPQLAEPGQLSWFEEKRLRTIDLNMLSYFGSRERSVADWEGIIKEADEEFEFGKVANLAMGRIV
ncbi:0b1972be-c645-42b0-b370-1d75db9bcef5 [Sclerotinia trifoliorum]|uniref:0b1972be-c645-42b0-b370-1d75db9bcef5 n=1 Tax=Sclerotinia trifoliorum TaxID=28548 RepID=A0A8H2VQJ7_9HELO|nr:0b1972be-c645-42b0-b370-1d75db9bcef5 [Sclerotinia trifoliorum]